MRIEKLRFLEDYKCIKKGTEIDFSGTGNYCALVGLNGSGKTSVLNHLLNVILPHNNNLDSDCYYNSNIMDYISTDNGKLPNLVVHIYNGETKFGSRLSYREEYNMYVLQLDSSIWCLASFILQSKNDSLIDKFKLKSKSVADLIDKITKECDTDIDNELYNKTIQKDSRGNKHKVKKINKNGEDDYLNCQIIETQRKQLIDRSEEDWDSLFWYKILSKIKLDLSNTTSFVLPEYNHYVFRAIAFYILSYYTNDDNEIYSVHSLQNFYLNLFYDDTTLQLSEGQKSRLVLQFALKYLAVEEKNTLFLLDEPDAYLDVQKKRDLFNLIRECKGQVIMSTHDPIMTKWMKGHLIFMDNGKQLPSKMVDTINELSDGELSYQETLLMLSECRHYVFAEGKTDIAFIKKAIELLGYSKCFENVTFLLLGSSSAVEDKYYTTISDFLPKDTQKILFLFDADWGGYQGKMQIDKLKKVREKYQKLCVDKVKQEQAYNRTGKESIKIQIQKTENEIAAISATNFDYLDKLEYYFYDKSDDFETTQDGNKTEWFYLEDYFSTNSYPEDYKVKRIDIKDYFEDYLPTDDTKNEEVLTFHELLAFEQKCANQIFSKNANSLKDYFKDNLHHINDPADFEGFKPLLDKILEKLELPNEPTS